MQFYYHAKTGGFYCDEIHGPHTIMIPNPKWSADADSDEPELIEALNPASTLPPAEELAAISENEHAALLRGQQAGQLIEADENGRPVLVDPPAPDADQLLQLYTGVVQAHMDSAAQQRGYDDLASAVTYAEEPAVPKFQAEGRAFRRWRSECWAFCYALLDRVATGELSPPALDKLPSLLPALELEQ